ncbi:C4-dicarboxylate ABC transporter [Snodgrassella communis]|uniref:YfcC family protein n=1 Tax=Snodgrassella communis TaxID=2946699 RepID=UPI000C1DF87E|nr:YfcC family protein [Snodgrassella communis]PIT28580.1 C4-dicarboxylate ABC transporter [Snodgrassella communis]
MQSEKNTQPKEKKKSLSAFSILFIILALLWIISKLLSGHSFTPVTLPENSEVVSTVISPSLSNLVMAPFKSFQNSINIAVFILVLGGFINVAMKTNSLEAGISALVQKLKGKELVLIPLLMFLFSIGGTVYGVAGETIAFYVLITATLVAAGFDTLIAVGVILLGAGAGVLGSTVNPFATGVAGDALKGVGYNPNQGTIITVGTVLWLSTLAFCIWYVMRYAKKIRKDKTLTLLSQQEQTEMNLYFNKENTEHLSFGRREKNILILFAFTFIVMIISLIPWGEFNITVFNGWTSFLTGSNFGDWTFGDLAMWFLLMSVVIGVVARMSEKDIIDNFIAGACDILSVVLIIVVARSISVLMGETHLDLFILDKAQSLLTGLSPVIFVPVAYLIYLGLSFLIPSTSALAFVSIPILGPLTAKLGMDPNIMIMIFVAGSGLVNLITPTSGVVMGGLQLSKVNYSTWLKFMGRPIAVILIMNIVILTVSMMVLTS